MSSVSSESRAERRISKDIARILPVVAFSLIDLASADVSLSLNSLLNNSFIGGSVDEYDAFDDEYDAFVDEYDAVHPDPYISM